jgi:hypothetical protein
METSSKGGQSKWSRWVPLMIFGACGVSFLHDSSTSGSNPGVFLMGVGMLFQAAYSFFFPGTEALDKIESRPVRVTAYLLVFISLNTVCGGMLMRWWWKDSDHLSWSNYENVAIALIVLNAVLYAIRFYVRRKRFHSQLPK